MIRGETAFPRTYETEKTEDLLQAFDRGPERLASVVTGLEVADLLGRPRPGKWSVKEIVMHVADSEIMGAARVRQVYCQPGSVFAAYDQNTFAVQLDYQNMDLGSLQLSLAVFNALRRVTSPVFHRSRTDDWAKTGVHPEHGVVTLRNLLELYADHSERHIDQILKMREILGKPLPFELLLKERLY